MPSSILNSDDGVISGTSGLKSSGGDDGNLVFQSKGTETARINTDKQIVAAAGTASLPALTTTGDVNTGIFFPAADQVAVATNGTERVNLGNSATVFNDGGADVDFRVESDTVENALFVDGATGNIGAGVLPSNFASTRGAVEVGGNTVASLALNSGVSEIFFNAYFDGSSFRRRVAAPSGYFNFNNAAAGGLVFSSAATGTAGDPITFTERARIDSSGNLLVGGTTASAKNYTVQSANAIGLGAESTVGSFTSSVFQTGVYGTTAGTGFRHIQCLNSSAQVVFQVLGNGNAQNTNNSYGSISDIKLKENIVDATPKLDKLNQVRIVNYNLIGEEQKQIGVIAQELEQLFPSMIEETVDRDAEGNNLGTTTKAVKYSVFVPMLIKAIQELSAKNDALEARIAALEQA
jgi:hypothetical protein